MVHIIPAIRLFLFDGTCFASGGQPDASIDFEAGRFFERADTRGTLDQAEFQRLWRAARSGEPLQPPKTAAARPPADDGARRHQTLHSAAMTSAAPPASDLPLPADFDAGARFERFARTCDGFLTPSEFGALVLEWGRAALTGCFEQYDHDRDGLLSRSDFLLLVHQENAARSKLTSFTRSRVAVWLGRRHG